MLAANTAEAGANINFAFTSVTTEPGKAVIRGYFYNNGDAGAWVKKMHFSGNIEGDNINVTFTDRNISVGYIDAGGRRDWSFTITDNYFKTYSSNPSWNLESSVTFGY